jgi:hypothetical protein
MSYLEIILTVTVWSLFAGIFIYYRSLTIKKQRNLDLDGKLFRHSQSSPKDESRINPN